MCRMSELSHQHRRCGVLKAESQTNDSASDSEHDQTVRESLQEHTEYNDHRADDDGVLPSNLFDKPPQEELGEDTTETLGTVEDT